MEGFIGFTGFIGLIGLIGLIAERVWVYSFSGLAGLKVQGFCRVLDFKVYRV